MLTPVFELSQDEEFLTLQIKAPFAKISETEVDFDKDEFKFYSKPYYLRLSLPGEIIEDGRESCQYEADTGYFTIKVAKANKGENFVGLDMLTKLLAPKGQTSANQPLIEVLESETCGDLGNKETEVSKDEEIDWFIEQHPYQEPKLSLDAPKYGFANQRSGVFDRLQEELQGVVDVRDADQISPTERRERRLEQEQQAFSDDHYLADLFENEAIKNLISSEPPWLAEWEAMQTNGTEDVVQFSAEEKEKMRKLPKKEYLIDESTSSVFLGLVDIMFAYAYNHRITEGENNVESSWTISKISSTLSWLEVFTTLQEVVLASTRRCLCFPLYRHWHLCMAVIRDVCQLFSIGKKRLLKCLLEVHDLLERGDSGYILNDLYITDYCVWIQSASDHKIKSLATALSKVVITKDDVGFHLTELEQAGFMTLDENEDENTPKMVSLEKMLKKMNLKESSDDGHCDRDSDDESTVSGDESTDSGDESTDSGDESGDEYSDSDDENTEIGDVNAKSDDNLISSINKTDSKNYETTDSKNDKTTDNKNVETTDIKNDKTTDINNDKTTDSKNDQTTDSKNDQTTDSKNDETTDSKNDQTTDSKNEHTAESKSFVTTESKSFVTTDSESSGESLVSEELCDQMKTCALQTDCGCVTKVGEQAEETPLFVTEEKTSLELDRSTEDGISCEDKR